jgi:hypothetical protein
MTIMLELLPIMGQLGAPLLQAKAFAVFVDFFPARRRLQEQRLA